MEYSKRLKIAKEIELAAANNILKNIAYYANRSKEKEALESIKAEIQISAAKIPDAKEVCELMGYEGHIRESYYKGWDFILGEDIEFEKRVKRPPDNLVNALISYGNTMMYSACLSEIYRSQLHPTISYLHEPGERRFSLALDMAEIFKPIIVDRLIFAFLNTKQIKPEHARKELNYCYLEESARKIFIKGFEEKLQTTIKHKKTR